MPLKQKQKETLFYIKQTRNKGFIFSLGFRIVRTDSIGNIIWDLDFNRDSIPGIKKSEFLSKSGVSDIYECPDGSFIALLRASFSLLKISKDGKPLWLKSTLFKDFDPMYFDYYPETKQWIKKNDSVGINSFVYNRGGGMYVPTYNVYQTDDNGYMAIGSNEYRYKDFITDYTDSNKVFYTTEDLHGGSFKKIVVPHPKKIYGIRKYPIKSTADTNAFMIQWTTCVVKTDKDGNVLWTKQFGESTCVSSKPRSTLLKLANGKWLVCILDCDSLGQDRWKKTKYSPPHGEVYMVDNNGNIIKQRLGMEIDPDYGAALAADSGYYFFSQDEVMHWDKNFN